MVLPEVPMDAANVQRSVSANLGKRPRCPHDEITAAPTVNVQHVHMPPLQHSAPNVAIPDKTAPGTKNDAVHSNEQLLLRSRDHYRLRKRVPMRSESHRCDVYVTRSARFRALQARCRALLDSNRRATLHAMGAAIGRACDLALAVQNEARGEVVLDVQTDTVVVFDDYEPLVPVC